MCGIAGIATKEGSIDSWMIKAMCDRLFLRGPDAEGLYINKNIGLGHRRLSILDLRTGDQPMFSTDGTVVVVFNGEIYNYEKLKKELLAKGSSFHTNSDTEVLINGYISFGIDEILNRIEGMFAFALYDMKNHKLFIARDKFGEKPLYYCRDNQSLWFASELKAFPDELFNNGIDPVGLNYFLTLTYIPAPHTIYKNVKKLKAGQYLLFDCDHFGELKTYFDLTEFIKGLPPLADFDKSKLRIREQVSRSVKERMISDVPFGVFLSGGIDSSIVTSLMSQSSDTPINTFTIGFTESSFDESHRSELVAKRVKSIHKVQYLDYKDVVEMVDEILLHYDEPFGDSSAIPSYCVAKLASEKVKVVLTGDCADELFGGYEKYLGSYYAEKLNRLSLPVRSLLEKIIFKLPHNRFTNVILRKAKKVISNAGLSDFDLHYNMMSLGFNDQERSKLLMPEWSYDIKPEIEAIYNSAPGKHPLERSQFTDIKLVLEGDMFVKTDRICMKNSLESRAPFIDTRIIETVFRIPPEFKIKGKNKKYILKEAFKDVLPRRTLRYRKKGFGVPIDYWFKNELKPELDRLLDKEFIEKQGIFKYHVIKQLLTEHLSGKENHKSKLWNLFVFQKWYLNIYSRV